MNHKVLLADDSLTIQKVIKITLSNQPYEIIETSSEEDLFQKLPIVQPQLVLLDFNLSEKFTGYELTSKIKSVCPSAKILLLLGTFDSVDDLSMEKCGASDKIVKPFDSNKFIAICKNLIDSFDKEDLPYPEIKKEETSFAIESSDEDQWTVGHTTERVSAKIEKIPTNSSSSSKGPNLLLKEISDWGMSVPAVISDDSLVDEMIDIPPVIDSLKTSQEQNRPDKIETKYPDNEDLDYPTIEELSKSTIPLTVNSQSSEFTNLELEGAYSPVDNVKNIEAQIQDEVAQDLWVADEFEDLKKDIATKIDSLKNNFQPSLKDFDESLFRPVDDSQSISWTDVTNDLDSKNLKPSNVEKTLNLDELRKEMDVLIKKHVKDYMDELFLKQTEKVAWEVIPDLAENLIRQELSKISSRILNDQN